MLAAAPTSEHRFRVHRAPVGERGTPDPKLGPSARVADSPTARTRSDRLGAAYYLHTSTASKMPSRGGGQDTHLIADIPPMAVYGKQRCRPPPQRTHRTPPSPRDQDQARCSARRYRDGTQHRLDNLVVNVKDVALARGYGGRSKQVKAD
ncbi:hypothetical protein OH76DRAFT_527141 [Lentinus brumalis]|uniref:Uncharacterized protein n=1 Tax=Lentinus brumalis TaxID=2498619 RepID=A0A371DA19_9APHY|nr:hypothetical protein OH76DRAFT_527141 [Polyporus brumalis]